MIQPASFALALGLSLGVAAASPPARSPAAPAAPVAPLPQVSAAQVPRVLITLVDGDPARAAVRCLGGDGPAMLSLEGGLSPFGQRPLGDRAAAQLTRPEGIARCASAEGGRARSALRLSPILIRAVVPHVVREASGERLVVTIEGQALGPITAPDDGIYLVRRGQLQRLDSTCPEAQESDVRVVACALRARILDGGPARVRLQSAGRLEEAGGAPLDIAALFSPRAPSVPAQP